MGPSMFIVSEQVYRTLTRVCGLNSHEGNRYIRQLDTSPISIENTACCWIYGSFRVLTSELSNLIRDPVIYWGSHFQHGFLSIGLSSDSSKLILVVSLSDRPTTCSRVHDQEDRGLVLYLWNSTKSSLRLPHSLPVDHLKEIKESTKCPGLGPDKYITFYTKRRASSGDLSSGESSSSVGRQLESDTSSISSEPEKEVDDELDASSTMSMDEVEFEETRIQSWGCCCPTLNLFVDLQRVPLDTLVLLVGHPQRLSIYQGTLVAILWGCSLAGHHLSLHTF